MASLPAEKAGSDFLTRGKRGEAESA